jgi:hypothetical protein
MPAWTEVLGDGTIRGEKSLCMTRRFEPLHVVFALAGGLVCVLAEKACGLQSGLFEGLEYPFRQSLFLNSTKIASSDHKWHCIAASLY